MTHRAELEKTIGVFRDLYERAHKLEVYDRVDDINAYCDNLESDVIMAIESSIRQLQNMQTELLKEINEYRNGLLTFTLKPTCQNIPRDEASFQSLVKARIAEFELKESFEAELNNLLKLSDNELKRQRVDGAYCLAFVEGTKKEIRDMAFCKQYMRFKQNHSFGLGYELIGTLDYCAENEEDFQRVKQTAELVENRNLVTNQAVCETITDIIFLPNGDLVCAIFAKSIKILDFKSGNLKHEIASSTTAIACNHSGLLVSGTTTGHIEIWNPVNQQLVVKLEGHRGNKILMMSLLPNGDVASICIEGIVNIWRLIDLHSDCKAHVTFQCESNWYTSPMGVFSNGFLAICVSKSNEGVLRVMNPETGRLVRQMDPEMGQIFSLLVLSTDQVVLGSAQGTIKIFDVVQKTLVRTLVSNEERFDARSLLELPNGIVVAGCLWEKKAWIHAWDLCTGKLICSEKSLHRSLVKAMKLTPDKETLITGSFDSLITFWSCNFRDIFLPPKSELHSALSLLRPRFQEFN